MTTQSITELKIVKAKCPECSGEYEYIEIPNIRPPATCNNYECVRQHLHPELRKHRWNGSH